ncbi:GNAT family N-acetyltransferase [Deinococcus sp. UYEF24]
MNTPVGLRVSVTPDPAELAVLHVSAFRYPDGRGPEFWNNVMTHSLCWVTAHCEDQRCEDRLIGFTNVAWDGGMNAFLLDIAVHPAFARQGVGSRLVRRALFAARARGASWMHVDYAPHLQGFYLSCGFTKTRAGRQRLKG